MQAHWRTRSINPTPTLSSSPCTPIPPWPQLLSLMASSLASKKRILESAEWVSSKRETNQHIHPPPPCAVMHPLMLSSLYSSHQWPLLWRIWYIGISLCVDNISFMLDHWAIDRIEEHALTTIRTMPAATFPIAAAVVETAAFKGTHQLFIAPMQIHWQHFTPCQLLPYQQELLE